MKFLPPAERIAPLLVVAAAIVLISSEFMVAFEFTPPGGEPLRDTTGGDRHGYSMVILGAAAIGLLLVAITTGSKWAAIAVGALGGVALLLFLVIDLPDVGQRGDLRDPLRDLASAEAVAQAGFWMQAIGALGLAAGGAIFASLTPTEITRWRPGNREPATTTAQENPGHQTEAGPYDHS